jgi:hypothetical protein
MFISTVHATSANIDLYLPNGSQYISPDDPGSNPVPLGTVFTVEVTYTGTASAKYSLTVWYSTTQDGTYSQIATWVHTGSILNGHTLSYPYTVDTPGWYIFEFNAGNNIKSQASANASAGPVLSEPATLAALGLCFVAVGAVLVRKKRAKQ